MDCQDAPTDERRLPGRNSDCKWEGSSGASTSDCGDASGPADHVAVLHYGLDFAKFANVSERVAIDCDDIGEFSRFDCTNAPLCEI
jgi:hypothetical protein